MRLETGRWPQAHRVVSSCTPGQRGDRQQHGPSTWQETAQCHKRVACHAKARSMSPSATPATPNDTGCHQVPRLPHQIARQPRKKTAASPADQACHQSQPSAISAMPATQSEGLCLCRQVPRLPVSCVWTSCVWVSCVWKSCVWVSWVCVRELCERELCVCGRVVCEQVVCEQVVREGALCVWGLCVWVSCELCVSKLCVSGRRKEAGGGRRSGRECTTKNKNLGGLAMRCLSHGHKHTTLAGKDPARQLQVASYLQAERCLKILLAVW